MNLIAPDDELAGQEEQSEEGGLNAIRVETALSRFPCHRIARKGNVMIEIKSPSAPVSWEVTYNSKYGQPGPLAYKVDTLIVNRRVEEAGRPVPRMLKLGSLRDICRELGTNEGRATGQVKNALHQNASAYIDAKFTYRATDGTRRDLEAGFNRYAVVFTGETLPDGRQADAVYLILSDIYQEVLNHAVTRPLDYNYMQDLSPAAQRFYEIVSYKVHNALKYNMPCATLAYSEYCLLSTATRYFDFDHVKKQMFKIHKPHTESGYLGGVRYEATTDAEGRPDWKMLYTPGPNAGRAYKEFANSTRGKRLQKRDQRLAAKQQPTLPFTDLLNLKPAHPAETATALPAMPELTKTVPPPAPFDIVGSKLVGSQRGAVPVQPDRAESGKAVSDLIAQLIEQLVVAGLNRGEAERLAGEKPEECRRQLAYLPHTPRVANPGGFLRRAIEGGFAPPKGYEQARAAQERAAKKAEAEARKKAEAERQALAQAAEAERLDLALAHLETDRPDAHRRFLDFVAGKEREIETKFQMFKPATRAKFAGHLRTPQGRRELFAEWQAQSGEEEASGTPAEAVRPS